MPKERKRSRRTSSRRVAAAARGRGTARPLTLLIFSQVYPPDPAAVGRHLHDAAVEMVNRGYNVRVLTAARGYENPKLAYARRETIDGVDIFRLRFSSFGKGSMFLRLLGQLSLLFQASIAGLWMRRLDGILVSTAPPMSGIAAVMIAAIRRIPFVYWVMDINPDQAVVLGWSRPNSRLVRLFHWANRRVLRRASSVVTLDRFMAERLEKKGLGTKSLAVLPPWPHEDNCEMLPHSQNRFRRRHGLDDKFVVMYSGNHTPTNPISTVIEAARQLNDRDDIVFVFVGGGICKRQVSEAIEQGARNIIDLPFQPLEELRYSLSSADVHVVTLGDGLVGIVHPCKVYGAMAVGRPILFVGPRPSHVTELLEASDIGRHLRHGDVARLVQCITDLAALPVRDREAMGQRAFDLARGQFSKQKLVGQLASVVEQALLASAQPYNHRFKFSAGAGDRDVERPRKAA